MTAIMTVEICPMNRIAEASLLHLVVCQMQCVAFDRYKITSVHVCLSVCLSVRLSKVLIVHDTRPQFLSDLPHIWNACHTSDNEV